jgi:YVTN family beta-propeller protein
MSVARARRQRETFPKSTPDFYRVPRSLASTTAWRHGFAAVILAAALALALTSSGCKKSQAQPEERTAVARIPTPPSRALYVTNNGSDSISVVDRDGDAVTHVPIDIDPKAHEAPHHLAIDSARGSVYVALAFPAPPSPKNSPHASHGNADTRGKLARLDLATLAVKEARDVDTNPGDVILTRNHERVLVTHFDMKRAMDVAAKGGAMSKMLASIQLWDRNPLRLVASRPLCVAPHGMVTTPDDTKAIVACYGSDTLAVVDLTSPTLATAQYPLGASPGVPGAPQYGPYFAQLLPDGNRVVVSNLEGKDVRLFDLARRRFDHDRSVDLGARALMPEAMDDRRVLVPLQSPDGLVRIDMESARVEARVSYAKDECELPHVVRRARDGRVYLVCEGDHQAPGAVLEIDPESLATKRRWVVGVYPDGIAFGDD